MRVKIAIWNRDDWTEAVHILAKVINGEISPAVVKKVQERLREEGLNDTSLPRIQEKVSTLKDNLVKPLAEISSDAGISVIDLDQIRVVYEEILDLDSVDYEKLPQVTGFSKEELRLVAVKLAAYVYQMIAEPRTY